MFTGFWDGDLTLMGRTIPTFRQMIESFGMEWMDFKKGLRKEDKELFEALLNHARRHSAAGHNFSHAFPFEPIVISILLEHEKQLHRLQKINQDRRKKEDSCKTG
jgi:predicted small metal-binding protein